MYELEHDDAIITARQILKGKYLVLDTETTGIKNPFIVQVGYVLESGENERMFIRPGADISESATAVHGITNAMVDNELGIKAIWETYLRKLVTLRTIVGYNVAFDLGALKNSLRSFGIEYYPSKMCDVMLLFAGYMQQRNPATGTPKWFKLGEALEFAAIDMGTSKLHDALTDAIGTQQLLKWIANQRTYWEVSLAIAAQIIVNSPGISDYDKACFGQSLIDIPYMKVDE